MLRVIFSVTGSRIAASAIQAVTLLLLTRVLGAVSFGHFAAVSASCAVLAVLLGFGFNSLALRVSALENSQAVASTIALLRIPVALLAGAVAALGASIFLRDVSGSLILVAALYAVSELMGEGVESLLYGSFRENRAQLTLICRRCVLLLGVSVGIALESVCLLLGCAAATVVLFVGIPLRGCLGRPASFRSVFRLSAALWPATVLAKLQTLDVVIASAALVPVEAGVYSAASRVTSPLNTFAVSALSVITPRLSARSNADSRVDLFRQSRRGMSLGAGALLLMSPLVGWLTEVVLGSGYEGVFLVASVLTAMTAIAALTQVYVSAFYAAGDGLSVAIVRVFVVPTALVGGWVGAAAFGPVALALAMLASQLCQFVALAVMHRWVQSSK